MYHNIVVYLLGTGVALGSFNGIGSRMLRKEDFFNRNHSIKCVVFISFLGQTYPLLISHCPLLIEAIPLNDPSAHFPDEIGFH